LTAKHTNLLSLETSPYLLQHANNPVQWHAWNEHSLQKAAIEDKPIILSIGYSACHWCHVMEHESFENEHVAAIMNEYFVCIKVDREERPDVDGIYMDAIQAMGIHGGWPLNVFLMPDKKPFYGGTYFKPSQWANICKNIADAFQKNREVIQKSAESFAENLQMSEVVKYNLFDRAGAIQEIDFESLMNKFLVNIDAHWGGLNKAPKFPMPSIWQFLIEYLQVAKPEAESTAKIEEAAMNTLYRMSMGGIFDQIGGGFSRYSVDAEWFCPHFEKMLYDNAQLLSLYSKAYIFTGDQLLKETILQTIAWLKRDLLDSTGAFFAAQDADSEGIEGKFYVWDKWEVELVLGKKAKAFCEAFEITTDGNWEEQKNILWKNKAILNSEFEYEIKILLQKRNKRVFPGLDDKVICGWNALAIKGLVDSYWATKDVEILDLAVNCGIFIRENMYSNGHLMRTYKNNIAKIDGFLEDYAAVISAFIALYKATFDENWLSLAESLTITTLSDFLNEKEGFFGFSNQKTSNLIANKIELFDNVVPASNSIMAHNLYDLGVLISKVEFVDLANAMVGKMSVLIKSNFEYLANWASLALKISQPKIEVVVFGPNYKQIVEEFGVIKNSNLFLLAAERASNLPLFDNRQLLNEHTNIYVCINNTCSLPVNTVLEAKQIIGI
jgi:uncharacterized protein